MFANKVNRQTSVTSECAEYQKNQYIYSFIRVLRVRQTQPQLYTAFHSVKMLISILYTL